MVNQRGFIQLPMMGWAAVAAAAVIGALSFALKIQSDRLEACKIAHVQFVAGVKALGDAAAAKAKAEVERQAQLLKEAEVESAKHQSDLAAANKRLRDDRRARGSAVPPAPESSPKPHLACFDRTLLEQALRRLDAGVSDLVEEGATYTLRLRLARNWAAKALPNTLDNPK